MSGVFEIWKEFRQLARYFLIAGMVFTGSAAVADYDLRVVFVDTGEFAAISNGIDRQRAVSYLKNAIQDIEETAPARATILLFERAGNIDAWQGLTATRGLGGQAGFAAFADALGDGLAQGSPGFELVDLQIKLAGLLSTQGLVQSKWFSVFTGGAPANKSGHLVIVGQNWVTEASDSHGDVSGSDMPTVCVHEGRGKAWQLPGHIDMKIDFLPVLGGAAPSDAAQAALIAVVTGTADARPNVQTRGVTMPNCPFGAYDVAQPWPPNGGVQADQCPDDRRAALRGTVTACTSVPRVAGVAQGPGRTPVYLYAAPGGTRHDMLTLEATGLPPGLRISARVGPLAIPPGAAAMRHGLAASRYPAQIDVTAGAGCSAAQGFRLGLGDPARPEAVQQVAVSRQGCRDLSLPVGTMELN